MSTHPDSFSEFSSRSLEPDRLENVKAQFAQVGFTPAQIDQLITERQKRTHTNIPFENTNISQRYKGFCAVLKPFDLSENQIRNILSHGLIFSQLPAALKNLLDYIEDQNVSVQKFLQLALCETGCQVLGQAPGKTKRNIEEMATALKPYGIAQKEWIEICFKRNNLLKISSNYLLKNMEEMGSFLGQFGYGFSDWLKAAHKNPSILDKPAQTLIGKAHEMFSFLAPYGISPVEWIEAGMRIPQILYQIPGNMQKQILFYKEMYEKDLFIFTKHPKKDTSHLIRYLLRSPQSFCGSESTLELRKNYAYFMQMTKGVATSEIIYRTKKYILTEMGEMAPTPIKSSNKLYNFPSPQNEKVYA